MTDALIFSGVNVGAGFVVSWMLTYYLIPWMFSVGHSSSRTTALTMVYTVAALIRNVVVFEVLV